MSEFLGPVMLGITGLELTPEDRERLLHPATGAVILFTRNYENPEQLRALAAEIRSLRQPELLLAVDHEGGRVQRFRTGFTELPPMRRIGDVFSYDPTRGQELARDAGWLLAQELKAAGLDFSFTPVLDRDAGISEVIGDRAFHDRADVIARLGGCLLDGLDEAGMSGVGKHFPGHGGVAADSHEELPVDPRPFAEIEADDIAAFLPLLPQLGGIMPAHVIYPDVDSSPAGFSGIWLNDLLRVRWGFDGALFSDDLGMAGAHFAGSPADRAHAALYAGCDMVLICNDFAAADEILQTLEGRDSNPDTQRRLEAMRARPAAQDPARIEAAQSRLLALADREPTYIT
ncbi:beta-hexosaminidase [Thioalkalivibrio paradoxus ARh 1]|uniref:Beta-hexosaminidase n=2 Tax=Thioalkalivibrio paradoxus TaxID=108010 RepID=W0DM36_9GAMM|nr:beta-hexosaminidase [Thioalkalivibrio paradoxus ARh 1]